MDVKRPVAAGGREGSWRSMGSISSFGLVPLAAARKLFSPHFPSRHTSYLSAAAFRDAATAYYVVENVRSCISNEN